MADPVAFVNDLIDYMLNHVPAPNAFNVVKATLSIHQTNHTVSYSYPAGISSLQFLNQADLVFTQRFYQYFGDRIGNSGNPATEQPLIRRKKTELLLTSTRVQSVLS